MDKKDLKELEEMFKHQIGIVAEDFNCKLDLVIEGHQLLAQKIDATRSELKEDINNVDRRLMMVESRLDKKIDTVEGRLNNKIDSVEDRLNKKIDAVESGLNKKIDAVEEKLGNKLDAVAKDVSEHRADTEIHAGYKVSDT
jgi:CII-binding regulator of phage lambda lysogenization HflD